jgi:hypothetical protein
MAGFHYFMYLQLKSGAAGKKSKKQKKSTEYSKINQNDPKLGIYHVLTVSRQHKKLGSKIKKIKILCRLPGRMAVGKACTFADC